MPFSVHSPSHPLAFKFEVMEAKHYVQIHFSCNTSKDLALETHSMVMVGIYVLGGWQMSRGRKRCIFVLCVEGAWMWSDTGVLYIHSCTSSRVSPAPSPSSPSVATACTNATETETKGIAKWICLLAQGEKCTTRD